MKKRYRYDEQPTRHPLYENSGQDLIMAESPLHSNAMNYIRAVASTFHKESIEYQEFSELMKDLKDQRIEIPRLIARIKELFKGHRDLILGFNTFLPMEYQISLPPEDDLHACGRKPVDPYAVTNFVGKVKRIFEGGHVYERFAQWLSLYANRKKTLGVVGHEIEALFSNHPDLQHEFTRFLPHHPADVSLPNAQSAEYATLPSHDRRFPVTTRIPEKPRRRQIKEENVLMEGRDDKKSMHIRVDVDHGLQFDSQIDKPSGREDLVTDHSNQGIRWQELALSEEVKEILEKSDDYQELNQCLLNYKSSRFPDPHLQMLLRNILKDHPDLEEKFKDYFEKPGLLCAKRESICRLVKTEDCDADQDLGREAGDIDEKDRKEDTNGKGVASDFEDELGDKNLINHALDLHDFQRCTPSYRLLPKDYPIPKASHRTENDSKVLNDHLVAVTSGSEDRSFKYMRKNQYEYNLFRCEDDRFEVDMLLQIVKAAIRHVEQLIKKIDKRRGPVPLEDHLTELDFRCIERLYGDHGLEVVDALRSRASLALPIILVRLKQKEEEWARTQTDFNEIWAEIYAKNYHKSLDYQGFNFKQQDMKSLSTKALLSEIKEISDIKSKEDDVLRLSFSGKECQVIQQLEFEFPDPDIHDDLYQLVKYYSQQTYTPEHAEKLMNIWTTFFEPMLGIPSRPDDSEDAEDDLNAKDSIDKCVDNKEKHGSCAGSGSKQPISSGRGDQTPNPENSTSRNDSNGIQAGGFRDAGATSAGGVLPTSIEQISSSIDGSKENLGLNVENIPEVFSPARAAENTNPDSMSKMTASNVLKVSRCKRLFISSSGPAPKGLKIQIPQQAPVEEPETEREEGELSPDQDYQEFNFPAWGDTFEEVARSTKDTAGSSQHQMRTGGNENCGGEAAGEDDTGAHFEGEKNTKRLSPDNNADANNEGEESESDFENGGVSGSKSADGKKGSYEEPDEDGNENANDKNCESEREAEDTSDGQDDEYNEILPLKKYFLQTAKPLTKWAPPSCEREPGSRLFYGNDSFYLLFRLHNKLYERLQKAKIYSSSSKNTWRTGNDTGSTDQYARFLNAVYNLLDGSIDNEKFEHSCHTIIGRDSYILFTLDNLIHKIVKQLHSIATREINTILIQLHSYEKSRKPGTFMDSCYHANARVLLPDKDIFRIEYMPAAARLSIQLIKSCFDKADATASSVDPDFAAYATDLLDGFPERRERQRVFLKRNLKKYAYLDEESAFIEAIEGVLLFHGLDVRIYGGSHKVYYVLDTEDFLIRRSRRRTWHQKASQLNNILNRLLNRGR